MLKLGLHTSYYQPQALNNADHNFTCHYICQFMKAHFISLSYF